MIAPTDLAILKCVGQRRMSSAISPFTVTEAVVIEPVMLLGIPVDFILFALTLLGIAVFHHHTLPIALSGLAVVIIYKLAFTGFKYGVGLAGFGSSYAA